jgi:sensor histidine kinase regulating citrate/malate metabolism
VTSHRAGKKVILELRDNGLGIDLTKYNDSVFKLFKRFHTHVESRGIGLYLIKSQLEGLKGSIEIESEVDKGTLFRVVVPDAVFEMTLVSS